MPLQLGGIETMRPQVVTWDPDFYDQIAQARARISTLEGQGFILEYEDVGEARLLPPERSPDQGCWRILSENGDDRVVWDRTIPEQVKEAYAKFRALMKKGYTAYATRIDGSRGHKITEFDPGLQEIILGAILGTGSGAKRGPAGEAVLIPKTIPG